MLAEHLSSPHLNKHFPNPSRGHVNFQHASRVQATARMMLRRFLRTQYAPQPPFPQGMAVRLGPKRSLHVSKPRGAVRPFLLSDPGEGKQVSNKPS